MSQVDKAKFAALWPPVSRRASARRSPRFPAPRPRARCSTRCPRRSTSPPASRPGRRPREAEVDAAAAQAAAERAAARRRRGRRAPTTNLARLRRDASRRRSTRPATPAPRASRSTSAAWSSHIVADAVLFDAERGRSCAPRARPSSTRRADPDASCRTCSRVEGHANHLPVTRRRAVAVELGAVGLPGDDRRSATWPATACPRRGCRRRLLLDPAAGARDRPGRHHRQPPGRHRRPVHRLGRGQRPPAGHRRRQPARSNAMSTREDRRDRRRGRGQGRGKKKLMLIAPRRPPRRGRGGVLLPVLRLRGGAGRGAGVQRHLPRPRAGRGEPGRWRLPEDRGVARAHRGGRRRRPRRRARRLEGHRPDHLHVLAGQAPADVTGARDALKEALEEKIIEAYTEDGLPLVMAIYYTEYVTQ